MFTLKNDFSTFGVSSDNLLHICELLLESNDINSYILLNDFWQTRIYFQPNATVEIYYNKCVSCLV